MVGDVAVVLWHLEISHYNEKARWALDYKGIPHERREPMPGLHGVRAMILTRGSQRRLPVLDLEGRRIGDSTAIIAALEDYRPEPALYPADRSERTRALELEDFFDEEPGTGRTAVRLALHAARSRRGGRGALHQAEPDPGATAAGDGAGGEPHGPGRLQRQRRERGPGAR